MGGGRGGSYQTSNSPALESNLRSLESTYPRSPAGFFGNPGIGGGARQISSSDPQATAADFFRTARRGAGPVEETRPGVFRAAFKGGSHVVYRPRSHTDGSPVVEIISKMRYTGQTRRQKIHFVAEEKK